MMHLILRGLSCKFFGIDTMRKDWLYVIYIIFTGKSNVVDLPEVLWQDFTKFVVKKKLNEILSLRFWALALQQLIFERHEAIPLNSDIWEVYCSFNTIKTSKNSFGPIRQLLEHMLAIVPSESPHLKQHLEISVVFDPTQPAPISESTSGGRIK